MGEQNPTTPPGSYLMGLCGDCASGPPCRCSSDHAVVNRVWGGGKWNWVATCTPKALTAAEKEIANHE
jgi:hypothetical protein